MKIGLILVSLLICNTSFAVETAANIDLARYMGTWHELASIPQNFAEDCIKNTKAEYELLEDGLVKVFNSCEEANGVVDGSKARARVNPDFNQNSKLEVTFVDIFGKWIWSFGGDYWILDIDPDYQWSIVGNPGLDSLWILSRTREMDITKLLGLRDRIAQIGYDTCSINMSDNDLVSYPDGTRLCDL